MDALTYPRIDEAKWSARIVRWNALKGKQHVQRLACVERCKRDGHDYRETPVGLWCYCCCQYFRREGE
jgi:hypothetical protein